MLQSALAHDADAVADAEKFGKLRGDDEYRRALFCQLAQELVNFRFGADIDPARWFVKQKDLRSRLQPARDHDLLLVAA